METSQYLKKNEADVVGQLGRLIDLLFVDAMRSGVSNSHYIASALARQDVELADFLLGANSRFSLIEMKADEDGIVTEKTKRRRTRLLDFLAADSARMARSRDLHFIGWGKIVPFDLPPFTEQRVIEIAQYGGKVAQKLGRSWPAQRIRDWPAREFISKFLYAKTAGGNRTRFKRYLIELFEIAGKNGEGEVDNFQGSVAIHTLGGKNFADAVITVPFYGFDDLMFKTFEYDKDYVAHQQKQIRELAAERREREEAKRRVPDRPSPEHDLEPGF